MRDIQRHFHDCRGGEAKAADGKDGFQPPKAKEQAAQSGPEKIVEHGDHVDGGIAAQERLAAQKRGHACLHRRLVKAGSAVKQHEEYRRGRGDGKFAHKEQESAAQQGDSGIQRDHDLALIDAVGQHAAQQRKDDHRRKRKRAHAAKERRRACGAQKMERQGKAQDGVSKQGDDLAHQHDDEIALAQRVSGCLHKYPPLINRPSVCIMAEKRRSAERQRNAAVQFVSSLA